MVNPFNMDMQTVRATWATHDLAQVRALRMTAGRRCPKQEESQQRVGSHAPRVTRTGARDLPTDILQIETGCRALLPQPLKYLVLHERVRATMA